MAAGCVMVTGGAGFIGSAFLRRLFSQTSLEVVHIDKLTYAGNLENLEDFSKSPRHHFFQWDLADSKADLLSLFKRFQPKGVFHFAAESHVDRSIDGPGDFIQTNIVGTYRLLEASRHYWQSLEGDTKKHFRFLHVSTDEVYGSLPAGGFFREDSPYQPHSPYSASKAASDHLVRAWGDTYQVPILITNCSNNYGPFQFPEKLLPVAILNALSEKPIPVYGRGANERDWLFVEDHVAALWKVFQNGVPGETYLIGTGEPRTNLEVLEILCALLDVHRPRGGVKKYAELLTFVQDRPGHDLRYAIDSSKIRRDLGWQASETLEAGLQKTIAWYCEHEAWCKSVSGHQHEKRLGLNLSSAQRSAS